MKHMNAIRKRAGEPEDRVAFIMRTLKNTELPYLIVEGVPDESAYRRVRSKIYHDLECRLYHNDEPLVQILIAEGKPNVLKIYRRRAEFKDRTAVAFMVDKDDWLFLSIPKEYEECICTTGYSIENDLYADGNPCSLIPSNQQALYYSKLGDAIQDWAQKMTEITMERKKHPYKGMKRSEIKDMYQKQIRKDPGRNLQGKKIFELLLTVCDVETLLELHNAVFSTIDWDNDHPPLLSKLMWNIQKEIAKKQAVIGRGIDIPSLKKWSDPKSP